MNKLSMQNSTPIQPITLTGRWVRVEPLALAHTARLVEVCRHAEIWRYLRAELKTEDDVRAWIAAALDEQQKGNELPFAIIDLQIRTSGRKHPLFHDRFEGSGCRNRFDDLVNARPGGRR
jgi:hypothetical protein